MCHALNIILRQDCPMRQDCPKRPEQMCIVQYIKCVMSDAVKKIKGKTNYIAR